MSWLYGLGVRLRNARFNAQSGVQRLPLPVISVGNLTAGGTGKTPMVAWLARELRARGHRPLIAMRGYGAVRGERGDEEREYAELLPNVPVVANPKRFEAVTAFLAGQADPSAGPDCVLLDDGFQHRQVARALDLVLVDAQRPALDDRLLPSGWLREPASGLRRASAVIVTRSERAGMEALEREIRRCHGGAPIAWTRHVWRRLECHHDGVTATEPTKWLRDRKLVLFAGVGNPESVRRTAEEEGALVVRSIAARDHVRVTDGVLREITEAARSADALLVTRKDWVKIAPLLERLGASDMPPWVVPDLALEFVEGPDQEIGDERLMALVRKALASG
jgi:tetraacyldisaccharide 4'-kinase